MCMDEMKPVLLKDKLVEYACKELLDEQSPIFHKLLYVHTDNSKSEVLWAAMLQKEFTLILVNFLYEAKYRLLEYKEIEQILCDLLLPDSAALEFFYDMWCIISEKCRIKTLPIKILPFIIFTAGNDLAMEYQYRHEGVSDYITAPVNIPELIWWISYRCKIIKYIVAKVLKLTIINEILPFTMIQSGKLLI